MIKKEGYLNYIHLFRGFAILIIVGIHCRISFRWPEHSIGKDLLITFLDNGTVLFVFIAGFLFQYLKHKFHYVPYLKRKAKYVILPYILASLPAILYKLYLDTVPAWMPDNIVEQSKMVQAVYMLATGKHLGPFWFIPMIVVFYLISPLLNWLDKPVFYKTVFPVIFVAGLFTFRFGYFSNTFDSFIHYFPVYMFGMWGARYRHRIINLRSSVSLVLVAIYIVIAFMEASNFVYAPKLSSFQDAATDAYFMFNFAKLKVSILCVILLREFHVLNKEVAVLKLLGDYSFGIYFIHLYVITAIELSVKNLVPDFRLNMITFFIYTALVTAITMGIVYVIKKVTGRKSRYFIGS
ncbi:hypothetical protein C900_04199 [Fulvivirga imtechensis AK7]|uniref:Acyltransferase 3 domain-containing protein n=1 Tax=Fulvivirga imtechensis AK7 TaxID=1237149 RepID=L8K1M2_9BACT|nr:acyltransferase [Fulvivirga imtechensis]ELR73347.1 hypothetical protein C900_04199 [Fulvivirga imtechensis AK7]